MIASKDNYACVIEGQLYYGNSIPAKNEEILLNLKVESIVDLIKYVSEKKKIIHSDSFTVLHLEVDDVPTNNIDWCEKPAEFIDQQISLNKAVYVHCEKGISRSSALIIYYLMTRKKQNLKDTFDQIRKIRNVASPNYGFMKGLSELEQKLYGKITLSPLEYSLQCIFEVVPSIDKNEIEKIYHESEKEFLSNPDSYNEMAKTRKIEPIGYYTIEKIFKKYGNRPFLRRVGCSFHHPFE